MPCLRKIGMKPSFSQHSRTCGKDAKLGEVNKLCNGLWTPLCPAVGWRKLGFCMDDPRNKIGGCLAASHDMWYYRFVLSICWQVFSTQSRQKQLLYIPETRTLISWWYVGSWCVLKGEKHAMLPMLVPNTRRVSAGVLKELKEKMRDFQRDLAQRMVMSSESFGRTLFFKTARNAQAMKMEALHRPWDFLKSGGFSSDGWWIFLPSDPQVPPQYNPNNN